MDNAEETRPAEKAEIIDSDLVRTLETAIEDGNREEVSNLTEDLRAPDLADLIEALPQEQRAPFILSLGSEIEFDAFSELDEAVRDPLLEELPNEYLAKAVVELESDDAAYVLDGLEEEDREDVLQQMPIADRTALRRNLEYDEETAGRIMQADFVTVAPFWNV
ncbi:MAG: magnesium transporter, partial [Pseudomonadota bacterium]